jgi:NitT/TauT family transport system substrate-binding protein
MNRMLFRKVFCAALAIALLVLPSTTLRAAGSTKLHVVVIDSDGFEAFFAQDTGMFKRAGLDVELTNLVKGATAIEAVSTGNAQIGIANTLSLAQAREHGIPITWISPAAVAVSSNPSNAFVVWPSSPIKSLKDLTGKTVGTISLGGLIRLVLNAWIDRNGGDSTAVKFVELVPAQVAPALERGTVDAATLTEPMLTIVRPKIRSLGNPFDGLGNPRIIVSAWFGTTDWIAQNPQTASTFDGVMREAARWANDPKNARQATAIITKYTGVQQDLGTKSYALTFEVPALQPIFDAAVKYKMLAQPITVDKLVMSRP